MVSFHQQHPQCSVSHCQLEDLHMAAMQCPLFHHPLSVQMFSSFSKTGVNQWDVDAPPKYISNTSLSARVGGLNPRWNEDQSAARTDGQFLKAVQLTGSEFLESVDYISKVTAPLSQLLMLSGRLSHHPQAQLLVVLGMLQ